MISNAQRTQYADQGFFIAEDAVAPDMLEELAAAGQRAADKHRVGAVVVEEDGVRVGDGAPEETPGHGAAVRGSVYIYC